MTERDRDYRVRRELEDRQKRRSFPLRAPANCSRCGMPIPLGTEVTGHKVGTWIIRHIRCP